MAPVGIYMYLRRYAGVIDDDAVEHAVKLFGVNAVGAADAKLAAETGPASSRCGVGELAQPDGACSRGDRGRGHSLSPGQLPVEPNRHQACSGARQGLL